MSSLGPVLAATAGLLVGPLMRGWTDRSPAAAAALHGFAVALVAGLCLLHLGPHAVAEGGWAAVVGMAGGLAIPALMHRYGRRADSAGVTLAFLGIHAAIDGVALSALDAALTSSVTLAIVAHRLPVGVAVAAQASSAQAAVRSVGALAALTLGGWALGGTLAGGLPAPTVGALEGLVVGTLLHVGLTHHGPLPAAGRRWRAGGALLGLAVVALYTSVSPGRETD